MVALTGVTTVLATSLGSNASAKPTTAITKVQEALCTALDKALPSAMSKAMSTPYGVPYYRTGYDKKSKMASCTIADKHANVVTLYQYVGANGPKDYRKVNRNDANGTGIGCNTPDRGQLDTSPFNDVKGTTQAYGCNLTVNDGITTERVDALTTDDRVVALTLTCGSGVISWSSQTIADTAFPVLLKAA